MEPSIKEIQFEFQTLMSDIGNEILTNIYSNFNFQYFTISNENIIDKNSIKLFLHDNLSEFKFITYKTSHLLELHQIIFLFDSKYNTKNPENVALIICVEKKCIIIDSIENNLIDQFFKELQSYSINISINNENQTQEEKEAIEEAGNFYKHFTINNNFVKLTIHPIISYLIRRYFYPSNFFKDQSFFNYDFDASSFEQNFKTSLEELISSEDNTQFRLNFPKFANEILERKETNHIQKVYDFQETDFIELRNIKAGNSSSVKLVIHIQSLYLFAIKTPYIQNEFYEHLNQHEINFNQKYSHRCLTRFYGFIKKNGITSFVYEFMSNGTLPNFIKKNKEKADNLFSFVSMNRIFQGISYIHSKSLIHRDIKPANILVDHNNNVFVSDFDLVRNIELNNDEEMTNNLGSDLYSSPEQHSSEKLDYSTDIFSFGLIIYFLFEKKDFRSIKNYMCYMKNDNQIANIIKNMPKRIQSIFISCIKFDPKERMTKEIILKNIIKEMNTFEYLDYFIINENEQKRMIPSIIQYFFENINCLYQYDRIFKIKIHTFYIFLFLDVLIQENNAKSIIKLGNLYALGASFERDCQKALMYFDLAYQKKDYSALVEIGKLYEKGIGVEKDYNKSLEYYNLAASFKNWKGYLYMGICYYKGYGVEKDLNKSNEYFDIAIKDNNPEALLYVATFYFNLNGDDNDYLKAKMLFELSVKQNNVESMLMLGYLYFLGKGVSQDYIKSKEYYKLAIKNNFYGAYINIANLYRFGYGVKQNISIAKKCLDFAVQQYFPLGLMNLAYYYRAGLGVNVDLDKAKELLSLAVCQDFEAYYHFADYYYKNNNYEKALKYYKKSSIENNVNAQLMLGFMYSKGEGTEINFLKSKDMYEKAAKNGKYVCYIILGEMYYNGDEFKQDYQIAKNYFEIGAYYNEPMGYVYLGHYYYEGFINQKDYSKAKMYYEKAVELGDSYGYLHLAKLYFTGKGVKKDINEAIKYLSESAEKGNWVALQNLGVIYSEGKYTQKNEEKAKKCFELSIKREFPDEFLGLGILYYEGKGVKRNYEQAKKYFELSAKQGNSFACINLAKYYMEGWAEKPDYIKALKYINQAVSYNNSYAFVLLGDIYLEGKEVEQSYTKAIEFYKKAADLNNSDAFLNLGLLYYQGKGFEKNYEKAIKQFELSATKNNSEALFKLGKLYYDGKCIKQNYKKAYEYFSLSAAKDNSDSYYYIGSMIEKGKYYEKNIPKAIKCYQKCIELHDYDQKFIIDGDKMFTYKYETYYNYYRSNNDLGLIYITQSEFQDIKLAYNYIAEAGMNEYPIGQNNLGLLYQFYLNKIESAEHMYERASKHNLAFAEYNLGYIKEKENKYKEMIDHYVLASKYENKQIQFRNQIIDDDEQLNISKSFIVFVTNLKLFIYYLSHDKNEAENYLIKAIFQLLFRVLFRQNCKSYSFQFEYDKSTKTVSNLTDFFFNCPLFKNINHRKSNSKWKFIETNSDSLDIKIEISNNDDQISSQKMDKFKKKDAFNIIDNTVIKNAYNNLKDRVEQILNDMNSNDKLQIVKNDPNFVINDDEIRFTFKDEKLERSIKYPRRLFELIINNSDNVKPKIDEVISQAMNILYEPPFNILFGRININDYCIAENISNAFYEGFDYND